MNQSPLTEEELEAIREREQRATPGSWVPVSTEPEGGVEVHLAFRVNGEKSRWTYLQLNQHDIQFLKHCHEDVVRLLATIDALTLERNTWRSSTTQMLGEIKDTFLKM